MTDPSFEASDPSAPDASTPRAVDEALGSAADEPTNTELAERLEVIARLPLPERAEALGRVYAELRAELEAEDTTARA